ncbi:hypothetical protein DFH06DRAFT_1135070 [Mycena polygramma]|nr:hypothetical protein DFH06DRAFT_1135070 [Mycena polygramma]
MSSTTTTTTTTTTTIPELLSQPVASTQLNNSANFWLFARLPLLLSPHLSLVVWGQGEPSALRVELHVDYRETHRVVLGRFDVANSNLKQQWCIGDTTCSLMMVVNEAINISHRRPPYCRRRHIWAPDHQTFAEALGDAIKIQPPAKNPDFLTHMLPGRDVVELDREDTWGNRYVIFDPDQAHADWSVPRRGGLGLFSGPTGPGRWKPGARFVCVQGDSDRHSSPPSPWFPISMYSGRFNDISNSIYSYHPNIKYT